MATATKTPAHLTPTSSGAKPAGLTKVTASQWQSLLHLSATGQLHGVPPVILAAIQQAEAPALGEKWTTNGSYGGGFGVGVGTLRGQVPTLADLEDQSGTGYDAQAIAASDVYSDGLIANNGNTTAAEFYYQNGGDAVPGVPNKQGQLPTLEGSKIFARISAIPTDLAGKWGNSSGVSKVEEILGDFVGPRYFVTSAKGGQGLSQGAAQAGTNFPLLSTPQQTAATKVAAAADTVTAAQAAGGANTTAASASSGGLLSGIETGVHDDLMVAGYLLGGSAALILGAVLAFKQQSGSEEIGWLLLWLGGTVLWATLTKRSPICVFKSVVSGTNTTGCVGTISGGNLFAGTLTALGAVFAGSAALNALKGTSGGGGGGGGGNEKTSAEDTAGSEGSTVAEDVGSAAEDFAP